MKSTTRIIYFQMRIVCLLVCLCLAMMLRISAQTNQKTKKIIPAIPEGYTIIDGDIQMPIKVVKAMQDKNDRLFAAPGGGPFFNRYWPNGVIPYMFQAICVPSSNCTSAPDSGCVSITKQNEMIAAMNALEAIANIDFQQCPNNLCGPASNTLNWILIRDSTNDTVAGPENQCVSNAKNSSFVGMQGNQQNFNIVSWGYNAPNLNGVILHELLHALGFFHEQSRPDRNLFVSINCDNIQGGCSGDTFGVNFTIHPLATAYGYYDFDSVMHYGRCDFSIDCPVGSPCNCTNLTIEVLPPFNTISIGQRTHLSSLDQSTLSFIYAFPNWRFFDAAYGGGNGSSDGSFFRPFTNFTQAVNSTPVGGTLWLLATQNISAVGTYDRNITIRAAPGVTGTFGN